MSMDDEIFMREALLEAKKAFVLGEVPIGCVFVLDGKIVSRAHNLVEDMVDASAHAEMLCLQKAAKILDRWRLGGTLYCTLEPCSMCAGALALYRVERIAYGAPDLRHGANGTAFDVLNRPHPIHQVGVTGRICMKESKNLMQEFFRKRRRENVSKTV